MFGNALIAGWFDNASKELRENLGELEGVSTDTLRKIDHISRPTGDGPTPNNQEATVLYERLVLLALTENALAGQRAGATRAKPARKASYRRLRRGGSAQAARPAGSIAIASPFAPTTYRLQRA